MVGPVSWTDSIVTDGTLNKQYRVLIQVDRDLILLEADIAPAGASAGQISVVMGLLDSLSDANFPVLTSNFPTTFNSGSSALPTLIKSIYVGNRGNSSGLITLNAVVNQEYKNLPGAVPIVDPVIIKRGEVLIVAVKNLTSSAQTAQWNFSTVEATDYYAARARVVGKGDQVP